MKQEEIEYNISPKRKTRKIPHIMLIRNLLLRLSSSSESFSLRSVCSIQQFRKDLKIKMSVSAELMNSAIRSKLPLQSRNKGSHMTIIGEQFILNYMFSIQLPTNAHQITCSIFYHDTIQQLSDIFQSVVINLFIFEQMGNSSPKNKSKKASKSGRNATELIDVNAYNDEFAEEEYIETTQCCGMSFTKTLKRKIIWENNFITHCSIIKDEFRWANELIELVNNNHISKTSYFKEINNLKVEIGSYSETEREILISPSEVQQFKSNLKKSVLVSCSQPSKHFQENSHRMASSISISGRPNKIEISRFRDTTYRGSTNKKLQRSPSISSSKSGLRKSIMSFVDDTLSSVFGNERQISKLAAKNLQIFLKFSMILEKHFNDPKCMLSQIKKKFIDSIVRNFSDYSNAINKISELIDSINQMVKILKETIIDYYNLNSFAEGELTHNPFIANEDNLSGICTTILFKEKLFYEVVFQCSLRFNIERETKFDKVLEFLEKEPPTVFYIKEKFCLNQNTIASSLKSTEKSFDEFVISEEPYQQCKLILNQLETSKSPIGKMKTIYRCSEMMNKEIQKFYDVNGLQRQKWVLDADQVLSIFCYIIVGAKIKHLHTHLFILDNFSTSSQMISIFGYYLSVMNCAVEQLQNDYIDKIEALQNEL